jgi:hypothetical protein
MRYLLVALSLLLLAGFGDAPAIGPGCSPIGPCAPFTRPAIGGAPVFGAQVSSLSLAAPNGVPANALIIVLVVKNGVAASSVTDSAGNTYTRVSQAMPASAGLVAVFHTYNSAAIAPGGSITLALGETVNAQMSAFFVTNVTTAGDPLDVVAFGSGTGTSPSATTSSPLEAGELFVSLVGSSATPASFTQDVRWNAPPPIASLIAPALAGGNVTPAGQTAQTYAPTFGSSVPWAAIVVGFLHFDIP